MALTTFGLVRTLHVLAAALVLGALTVLPWLRPRLEEAPDVRIARQGLAFLAQVERWILAPGVVLLLVLGLAMVEGPIAAFSFTAPGAGWLHIGTTLWLVLAAGATVMVASRRELQQAARDGAAGGKRVRTLWRRWTAGAIAGALATAGGIAVMGMKLGA